MRSNTTLILLLLPLIAEGAPVPHPFYDEKARGWFWKETRPDPVRVPEPEAPKRSESTVTAPQSTPAETPLTSAWFRAHLGTIRDAALDDPTPEKVRQYFLLQKILLDKAERFAVTARAVVLKDPTLDERTHRASTPTARALDHQAEDHLRRIDLSTIGKKAGLLFIFRSDCRYCHLMAPLISDLSLRSGLRLYAVTLDGHGLPGLPLESVSTAPALAQKLNLSVTPSLFLMVPGHGLHPVLEGSSTQVELEDRIIAAGRAMGLLPEPSAP